MADSNPIETSVIIPVYNEERYIDRCIQSIKAQDYDSEKIEFIFVDGNSTDNTFEKLTEYAKDIHNFRILSNPKRTVPYAMNIGIKVSRGKYIIRLDAHAEYAPDYISKCVYYLENTDAENVGGVAETKSHGYIGNAIALMLSSKFGVGNSRFRTNGKSGYVDTVPFGAFRREVFEKLGGYDERLTRNQDNEMNYRIRKNGGKIYLAGDIKFSYYCRDTIRGIAKMAFQNGKWNVISMKLCPGSMGVRHFIPLAFLLSLIGLPILAIISPLFYPLLLLVISSYSILDVYFSIKEATEVRYFPLLVVLFPIFHLTYGFGSIVGIIGMLNQIKKAMS